MKLLTAPWVVPAAGPPVENGAVLVHGGSIAGTGPVSGFKNLPSGTETVHCGDSVLLPALLNAHAHLELTTLGPVEPGLDFAGWIRKVISLKKNASEETFAQGVRTGAAMCLSFGQSVVADVVSVPAASAAYPAGPARFLKLAEIIAASDLRAPAAVEAAEKLLGLPSGEPGGYFIHSPYTAGKAAHVEGAAGSVARYGRFFTHMAESPDEIEFCLTGRGAVPERIYAGLPVAPPEAPGTHPLVSLDRLGLLGKFSVLVHCVQLDGEMMDLAAARNAPVVLCPRSNKNLKVGAAPCAGLLQRGVAVGLGTDSLLSAGDLDLLKDVKECVDSYGITPLKALELATAGSARVLGLEGERGSLTPGMAADILALKLGDGAGLGERIMNSPGVAGMWTGGEAA